MDNEQPSALSLTTLLNQKIYFSNKFEQVTLFCNLGEMELDNL